MHDKRKIVTVASDRVVRCKSVLSDANDDDVDRHMEASDDDDGVDFVYVHVGGVNEGDGDIGVGNDFVNGAIGPDRPSARAG